MNVATQPQPVEATYVDLAMDTGGANLPAVQDPQRPPMPSGTVATRQDAPVHYPPKMAKAILAVMKAVGPVAKASENKFHHYFYQSWDDILVKLSPLLAENGLIISQSQISQALFDNDTLLAISYEFTLINEDGDVWPARPRWTAFSRLKDSKGMYDDKAANKCHTQASKYFLLHLFKIRTEDADSDADGPGQRKTAPSAAAATVKKIEPGVNPETGEVGPYAIPTTSTTIRAWADTYIAAIKTSRTIDDLEQWAAVNDKALSEITTKASKVVNKQIDDAYEALKVGFLQAEKAKEAKPTEQPGRKGPPSAKAAAAKPAAPDWRRDMIGALSGFTTSEEIDAFVLGLKDERAKVSEQDWDAVQVEIDQARRRIALGE